MDTVILTRDDVHAVVSAVGLDTMMDETIRALIQAFIQYDENTMNVFERDGFSYTKPHPSLLEWMPVARTGDRAVVKMVSYNPINPMRFELPTIVSTMNMYDLKTGNLRALCDGTYLTAVRTGAASAIASELLAHPDSSVIGLIGCGAQAVTQLHALSRCFHIDEVLAFDINESVTDSFIDRTRFLDLPVRKVSRDVIERNAHIICTATSVAPGAGPVLDDAFLRDDVHINAVGSDMAGKTELPLTLLHASLVCPDYTPQAILEGECQQLHNGHIGPSLIEIVKNPNAYVSYQAQKTVFDSTGFALEDMAAMEVLLAYAERLNVGQRVNIESVSYDAFNPYSFVQDV
ncbi:MAG: ornithine cyclodeaminase family protein [Anaerolineae bacterium]|nr:ornithine cyclodeaminase family protein [Anaerolineae bacterium]MCO5196884.1 ornithine cyclodeaminase family protein [Anaerolineae bacterium]